MLCSTKELHLGVLARVWTAGVCCAALVRGYLASTGLEEDGSAGGAVPVI